MEGKQEKLEKFNAALFAGFKKLAKTEKSLQDYLPLLKCSVEMKNPLIFSKFSALIKDKNAKRMISERDPAVLKHLPFDLKYQAFSQRSKTTFWSTMQKLSKQFGASGGEQGGAAAGLVSQAMQHVPASFKPMIKALMQGWTKQTELMMQMQDFENLIESSLAAANMSKQQIALFLHALHSQLAANLPPKLDMMAKDALREIDAQIAARERA